MSIHDIQLAADVILTLVFGWVVYDIYRLTEQMKKEIRLMRDEYANEVISFSRLLNKLNRQKEQSK